MSEAATSERIGQPVRRKEDLRLMTGKGCYSDDLDLPGQAYAAIRALAARPRKIRSIDTRRHSRLPA